MNDTIWLTLTVCGVDGLILPFPKTVGFTVYVATKLALIVWVAVTLLKV